MSDVQSSTDARHFLQASVKARPSSSPSMADARNVSDVRSPSVRLLLLEPELLLLDPCLCLGCPHHLPRHLALCVQEKHEPLRDYLQWWIKLRNTCEGVHEIQAIQYFTNGCLDGSLL